MTSCDAIDQKAPLFQVLTLARDLLFEVLTVTREEHSMQERRPKGVYVIIEKDTLEKPVFRRIGTAFVNRDASINVYLDAVPLGGKLHIRDVERVRTNNGPDWSGRPESNFGVDRASAPAVEQG